MYISVTCSPRSIVVTKKKSTRKLLRKMWISYLVRLIIRYLVPKY